MPKPDKYLDQDGTKLSPGDSVVIKHIPKGLLGGLPEEDQRAINACIGRSLKIVDFSDQGEAEIEFVDAEQTMHTIWISPACLQRRQK